MPTIMLLSPVLYSSNNINSRWIEIYSFNPLVSVIEGFRAILNHTEIPWEYILKGGIVSVVIFFFGLYFFSKNEYKLNDYL
jgi:ABC-type polysaccharide/polyol phosphate export permease